MEEKSRVFKQIRRFLSAVLCIVLIVVQNSENPIPSFAGDNITLKANYLGESVVTPLTYSQYDAMAEFDYGKCIDVNVYVNDSKAQASEQTIYINSVVGGTISNTNEVYDSSSLYAPGLYCFNYDYETESEGSAKIESRDNSFGFEIIKTPLSTPTNLTFTDGSKATWDTVSTDRNGNVFVSTDGNAISATVNYSITLYKDGAVCGDAISVTGTSGTTQSYDLATVISEAGEGDYTFAVKAVCPDSLTSYYADSDSSAVSTATEKAVKATFEKTIGIESLNYESLILLAGSTEKGTATVTATVTSGWNFKNWSSSVEGITFGDSSLASTSINIPADYSGANTVTITAGATESTAPGISSFDAGTGDDAGKIVAKAQDTQSGIKAYAFSKNSSSPESTEWQTLPETTTEEKSFDYTPTDSGSYYFYVKDADGNEKKSDSPVNVSKITFSGYYSNSTKNSSYTEMYIGSSTYSLPSLSDSEGDVKRKGYVFSGWYEDAAFSGSPITSLNSNVGEDKTYYAKWTLTSLAWSKDLSNETVTYSGTNFNISASVNATTADKSYTLYKKSGENFEVKDTNSTGSFALKNVSDSGVYRIDATITYTDDNGETKTNTITGSVATITVSPATLTVTADNKTVYYKEDVPELTFTYSGFVGDDVSTQPTVNVGTLTTTYTKGNAVGTYAITFASDFSADNYTLNQVAGTLTVSPIASSEGFSVSLDKESYPYTGQAIIPIVTVKCGEDTVPSSDYDVTYDNNVVAGIHTITISLKNNYSGTLTKQFTIAKAGGIYVSVSMNDWTYGETAGEPSIVSGIPENLTSYTTTYKYLTGQVTTINSANKDKGTTTKPSDAGTYTLYAEITDNEGNYEDIISQPCYFTVSKREIHIVAGSNSWVYDGNAHSYESYTFKNAAGDTITESDVFIESQESFQYVTVSGAITNAGTVNNTVSYKLTNATNEGNYNIVCDSGTLEVTPTSLPSPANITWDSSKPGTLDWAAITRQNLNVKYEVQLWESTGDGSEDTVVDTKTTNEGDTTVSFIDKIHSEITAGTKKSFYVKVKTVPSSGDSAENYTESSYSDASAKVYSVTIKLTTNSQAGLDTIQFADDATKEAVTLISGESFSIKAKTKNGYEISADGNGNYCKPINSENNGYFSESTSITNDENECTGTITVKSNLTASLSEVYYTVGVADRYPSIPSVSWENANDLSGVVVSATFTDELGLTRWYVEKVEKVTYTDEKTGKTGTRYQWISNLYTGDFTGSPTRENVTYKITTPGLYRIACRDTGGNGTCTSSAYNVYEIDFNSGVANDSTHTMSSLYKLEDTEITLPACKYEYTGYTLKKLERSFRRYYY